MKINMDKVKQFTLIITGVILLGVGFLNYHPEDNKVTEVASTNTEKNIGDVELVNSNYIVENETAIVENEVNNTKDEDYFTKTKLERDAMYSKMLENYNQILNNKDLAETQKSIAVQEIDKINTAQNSIMIAENLIMNKGFENAVIMVNNDAINVVVKSAYLSSEEIGKIQNIIEREFATDLSKVNISSK